MSIENVNDKNRMTDPSTEQVQLSQSTLIDNLRELVDVLGRVAYTLLRSPTVDPIS